MTDGIVMTDGIAARGERRGQGQNRTAAIIVSEVRRDNPKTRNPKDGNNKKYKPKGPAIFHRQF